MNGNNQWIVKHKSTIHHMYMFALHVTSVRIEIAIHLFLIILDV